jgi:YfiH family protein
MTTVPEIGCGEWRSAGSFVWWAARVGAAEVLFSTRAGGVSRPPYDSLNLGLHVGDAPEAVIENRRSFWSAAAPGAGPPMLAEQVHGPDAAVVGAADAGRGWAERETEISRTDALVTREAGVAMGILVADCAPVALVAPEGGLAVVHAGWRGLASGVLEAATERLAALGAGPAGCCRAVIGPCIRGCCYEVGEAVWSRFPEACLASACRPGARRLDLMAAVKDRLLAAGVPGEQIHAPGLCTACHRHLFFSHRRATREGLAATGRMALFAWLSG